MAEQNTGAQKTPNAGDKGDRLLKFGLAFLTSIGVLVPAYLTFQSNQNTIEIPLRATQTAEARRQTGAPTSPPAAGKTSTAALARTEGSPSTTAAQTPPEKPTPGISFENQMSPADWGANSCPQLYLLPGDIDPSQDLAKAGARVKQAEDNGELWQWTRVANPREAPARFQDFPMINGDPANKAWVTLERTANVSVRARQEVPDRANAIVLSGCGGGAEIKIFSSVALAQGFDTYSTKATSEDADFFTLQPGESDWFAFSFACAAPGTYNLTVQLPYTYLGQKGALARSSPPLMCPKSLATWDYDTLGHSLTFGGEYQWDDKGYAKIK